MSTAVESYCGSVLSTSLNLILSLGPRYAVATVSVSVILSTNVNFPATVEKAHVCPVSTVPVLSLLSVNSTETADAYWPLFFANITVPATYVEL